MGKIDTENVPQPAWAYLLDKSKEEWEWRGSVLWHRDAISSEYKPKKMGFARRFVLDYLYATQNRSRSVRTCTRGLVQELDEGQWGLNIGAGSTQLHHKIINLDIYAAESIDIVNSGHVLPFGDKSLDLIVSQEVIEHVARPDEIIDEVWRVLKSGGKFYCQVPFIIGFHPGPHDYWRFTKQGIEQLFSEHRKWRIDEIGTSLGTGSGFYRVAVEYAAVNASVIGEWLYLPMKAVASVVFVPFKISDLWDRKLRQRDRIAGGYYCVASKQSRRT